MMEASFPKLSASSIALAFSPNSLKGFAGVMVLMFAEAGLGLNFLTVSTDSFSYSSDDDPTADKIDFPSEVTGFALPADIGNCFEPVTALGKEIGAGSPKSVPRLVLPAKMG